MKIITETTVTTGEPIASDMSCCSPHAILADLEVYVSEDSETSPRLVASQVHRILEKYPSGLNSNPTPGALRVFNEREYWSFRRQLRQLDGVMLKVIRATPRRLTA